MINREGGLSEDGLVGRVFYPKTGATQFSLFEGPASDGVNYGIEEVDHEAREGDERRERFIEFNVIARHG